MRVASLLVAGALVVGIGHCAQVSLCQKGVTLYDSDNSTALTTFPVFEGCAYGSIDLFLLSNVKLTLGVEFCNSSIKSAELSSLDLVNGNTYSDSSAPFSFGGNSSTLANSFHTAGEYYFEFNGYGANGKLLDQIDLDLEVLPPFRFTLVDTNTGSDVASDFYQIDLALLNSTNFSIRVDTLLNVSSMEFDLKGFGSSLTSTSYKFVDSQPPYTLGGDSSSGHYKAVQALATPGNYILTVTATKAGNAKDPLKATAELYFDVLSTIRVVNFTLVDVVNNTNLAIGSWDLTIDPAQFPPNTTFTIVAETFGPVGSVIFNISEEFASSSSAFTRVDSVAPFSLDGDSSPDSYGGVPFLSVPGNYILTATPFKEANQKGEVGSPLVVYVRVLSEVRVDTVSLVDATTGSIVQTGPYFSPVDPSQHPHSPAFTISVATPSSVGSVEMNLTRYNESTFENELVISTVDSDVPYTLDGTSVLGHYMGIPALTRPGNYNLEITPYAGRNKQGYAGDTQSYNIQILSTVRIDNLTLVDANTGVDLYTSYDSYYFLDIDPLSYGANATFTIRANAPNTVGSIEFNLTTLDPVSFLFVNLVSVVDNTFPFTLDGTSASNDYIAVRFLSVPGTYQLTVTPFAGADKSGEAGPPAEPYEFKVLSKFRVENLTLVDASTGADATRLYGYDEIDLSQYNNTVDFTIRASVSPGVRSVEFNWTTDNGNFSTVTTIDSVAPFSLDGDSSSGLYHAVPELAMANTLYLQVTPYEGPDKSGTAGDSKQITLIILPASRIDNVSLVEISPDGSGAFLDYFYNVDLHDFSPNVSFTIVADTIGDIGSVTFNLTRFLDDGNTTALVVNDSTPPFSLDGKSAGGNYVAAAQLNVPGDYYLTITPFGGPNESGQAGPTVTNYFRIVSRIRVTNLTLVDVATGKGIGSYLDYIDLSEFPANVSLTIRADGDDSFGSVAFALTRYDDFETNSSTITIVDNVAPFTLDGNSIPGQFSGSSELLTPGYYNLRVTPYSKPNSQGEEGGSLDISFEVLPAFAISNFTLVETNSGKVVDYNFYYIDLSKYSSDAMFTIVADTNGNVGSVEFVLYWSPDTNDANSTNHRESTRVWNSAPFALDGHTSTGQLKAVKALRTVGYFQLTATPYSGVDMSGTVGTPLSLSFDVYPPFQVSNFTIVKADTGNDIVLSNSILDLSKFANGTTFTIKAITIGDVGSVLFEVFRLDGSSGNYSGVYSHLANTAPFALGDTDVNGSYIGVEVLSIPGDYYLMATPFSKSDMKGDRGFKQELELFVVDKPVAANSCAGFCGAYNPMSFCGCDSTCTLSTFAGYCCDDYCAECAAPNSTSTCQTQTGSTGSSSNTNNNNNNSNNNGHW